MRAMIAATALGLAGLTGASAQSVLEKGADAPSASVLTQTESLVDLVRAGVVEAKADDALILQAVTLSSEAFSSSLIAHAAGDDTAATALAELSEFAISVPSLLGSGERTAEDLAAELESRAQSSKWAALQ